MNRMLNEVNGRLFLNGDGCSVESAMEVCYGYSSAADSLTNMQRIAEMCGNGLVDKIKVVLNVDGTELPECKLGDAIDVLTGYEKDPLAKLKACGDRLKRLGACWDFPDFVSFAGLNFGHDADKFVFNTPEGECPDIGVGSLPDTATEEEIECWMREAASQWIKP